MRSRNANTRVFAFGKRVKMASVEVQRGERQVTWQGGQRRSLASGSPPRTRIIDSIHKLTLLWQRLTHGYEKAVVKDPSVATKIETILKALSYIVPCTS